MVALRVVAILPAALIFGALYLRDRAMGGYKAVKLTGNNDAPSGEPTPNE